MSRPDLTARAHDWLRPVLQPGGTALDATCGNGLDTLFLARALGPGGTVHAFDLQEAAIVRSRQRLDAAATGTHIHWHRRDHATLGELLADTALDAAMFNLGWLPGSESTLVTAPATTLAALDAAARLLRPGGRLSVLCYRGHVGGSEEATAVHGWIAGGGLDCLAREPGKPAPQGPILYILAIR